MLSSTGCDAFTYQIREKEFYKNSFEGFELDFDHYKSIVDRTDKKVGVALSDLALLPLCEKVGFSFYKTLSWMLPDHSFIDRFLGGTDKPIYVSTGTSSEDDIIKFNDAFWRYDNQLNFIHTTLDEDVDKVNLKAISRMKEYCEFGVGFGNHCKNLRVIFASLAYDPQDISFYVKGNAITYTTHHVHPDENWAVYLTDVSSFIDNIKSIRTAIGDGIKI